MVSTTSPFKIGIVGPESTGKTTLAHALSQRLKCPMVAEYARLYFAEKETIDYELTDIIHIAQGQLALEAQYQENTLVCDTHLLVCKIWAEARFGICPQWILEHYLPQDYTVHFLTKPDIPWVNDPLRQNPHDRDRLFTCYQEALDHAKVNYVILSGSHEARLNKALSYLKIHFHQKTEKDT